MQKVGGAHMVYPPITSASAAPIPAAKQDFFEPNRGIDKKIMASPRCV